MDDREAHIHDIIIDMLNCRELCGNESRCLKEYQTNNDITFTNDERFEITNAVQQRWNQYRKEAGII